MNKKEKKHQLSCNISVSGSRSSLLFPRMVGVFRRSVSFPNKINTSRSAKPPISHHIRSISLPCRSNGLVSNLKHQITELKSWSSSSMADGRTSAWLCEGLGRLKDVHDSLDDVLQLPQTQESLRNGQQWIEKLLEDFLRFVDVYGIFQTSVMVLKEEQLAAQVAVRRRDDARIASHLKARKKIARETAKLVTSIRCIRKQYPIVAGSLVTSIGDVELAAVIGDVIEATVSVSVALFNGIYASFASRTPSWMGLKLAKKPNKVKVDESIEELKLVGAESLFGLRKKRDDEVRALLRRMQEMEGCIAAIETSSQRVFRGLINTRVSLLNAFTN